MLDVNKLKRWDHWEGSYEVRKGINHHKPACQHPNTYPSVLHFRISLFLMLLLYVIMLIPRMYREVTVNKEKRGVWDMQDGSRY